MGEYGRIGLFLLLAGAAAAGAPPKVRGFVRIDTLAAELEKKRQDKAAEEAIKSRPLEEQLVFHLERGKKVFDGKPLDGRRVAEAILSWKVLGQREIPVHALKLLRRFPDVLGRRYQEARTTEEKRARYEASVPCVEALTSKVFAVRVAAIRSLARIYGSARLYRADLPAAERAKLQRKWRKIIRAARR